MPSALKIRKDMLNTLEQEIIPILQRQTVTQILAGKPFEFGRLAHRTLRKEPLPDIDKTLVSRHWEQERMTSSDGHILCMMYEGEGEIRVGATHSDCRENKAAKRPVPAGITSIYTKAPAVIFYPTHTPHFNGVILPRERYGDYCSLNIVISQTHISPLLQRRSNNQTLGTHHLYIDDPLLTSLGEVYYDEIKHSHYNEGAQAFFLSYVCRLARYLKSNRPPVGNSCWINPNPLKPARTTTERRHHDICLRLMTYIQTHLHTNLTLEELAKYSGLSVFHLNCIFQETTGQTVMRYVTSQRVQAAKSILTATSERVGDVAQLVGFSSPTSFSSAFRQQTGVSPREFRRQGDRTDTNLHLEE